MKLQDFEKLIKEIVTLSVKKIINEGISPIVWHFCPIGPMYLIARDNQFRCTSVSDRPSDLRLTSLPVNNKTGEQKMYPYYMCVSRTPYSGVGYQQMRVDGGSSDWKSCLVRIELDGVALSANYKGMPVNYFNNDPSVNKTKIKHGGEIINNKNDEGNHINQKNRWVDLYAINGGKFLSQKRMKYGKGIPGKVKDETDRRQMLEYEDRIYSKYEFIKNFDRYIKRIDIYCTSQVLNNKSENSSDILGMIKFIEQKFQGKVFIFNSKTAFNSTNIRNSINANNFNKYGNIDNNFLNNTSEYDDSKLLRQEAEILGKYTALIISGHSNAEKIKMLIFNKLGLNKMDRDIQEQFLNRTNIEYQRLMSPNIETKEREKILLTLERYIKKEILKVHGGKLKYVQILNDFKQDDENYLRKKYNSNKTYITLKKFEILNSL
jgi:hypothetical protein